MDVPFLHRRARPSAIRVELDVLARAAGGAMLFGLPLLFTMEMWWIGEVTSHGRILGLLAGAFVINVALARLSGFRDDARSVGADAAEAVEAMAVGAALSTICLFALGRLDGDASLGGVLGTICVQIIPLSLGATVANLVFDPKSGRAHTAAEQTNLDRDSPLRELLNDVGATIAGAIFVGFAIAPTDEIPMLAAGLDGRHLFAVLALVLLVSYVIVFASGFDPSHHARHEGGLFQGPISETILALTISLAVAAVMLFALGQISVGDPVHGTLAKVFALALPASIGGAAGRVVV